MQYLLVVLASWATIGYASPLAQMYRQKVNPDAYNEKVFTRPTSELTGNEVSKEAAYLLRNERAYNINEGEDDYIYYDKNNLKSPDTGLSRRRRDEGAWMGRMQKDFENKSGEFFNKAMDIFDRATSFRRDLFDSDKSNVTKTTHPSEIPSKEINQDNRKDSGNGSDATIALVYEIRNKTDNTTTAKFGQHTSNQAGPGEYTVNDAGDVFRVEGGTIRIGGNEYQPENIEGNSGTPGTDDGNRNNKMHGHDPRHHKPRNNQREDGGSFHEHSVSVREAKERNDRLHHTDRADGMGPSGGEGEANRRDGNEGGRSQPQTGSGNQDARM